MSPPPNPHVAMDEDEILGKAYDHLLARRLFKYLRPHFKSVTLAIVLAAFANGVNILQPLLLKSAVDNYIANGDFRGLGFISILFLLLIVTEFGLRYWQIYVTNRTGQRAIYDLRLQMFRHVLRLPQRFFNRNPIGRLMTRLTGDIEALNELFSSGLVNVLASSFLLVGVVIVLLLMHWRLALTTFTVLPIIFIVTALFRKYSREGFRAVRRAVARMNAYLQENITGMSTVQTFVREEKNAAQYKKLTDENYRANIKTMLAFSLFFPSVEAITAFALAIIIYVGGGGVLGGTLTFGTLLAFFEYINRFFGPVRDLSNQYQVLQQAMASSERIFKLLDEPNPIAEPDSPVTQEKMRGEVEFRNVSFGYDSRNPVLRDISFKIEPGQMVAIVGSTGAGKSTMINLLDRFWDVDSGSVLVDGRDIRQYLKEDLRDNIGIVLQDVFLFSDSIAFNIGLGKEGITRRRIEEICREIGLHDFIMRLPNGYDEPVGERGRNLSVGQRQLIAFARVLAYDPRILVLDEATSNTDSATEALIQQALEKILQQRTSIVIAHRLSTIQKADQIMVLHHGRIREKGNHQQLLAQKGIYHKLYQLQFAEQSNS